MWDADFIFLASENVFEFGVMIVCASVVLCFYGKLQDLALIGFSGLTGNLWRSVLPAFSYCLGCWWLLTVVYL